MSNRTTWALIVGVPTSLVAFLLIAARCTPSSGDVELTAGQIVVSKLGKRGLITMPTPYHYGTFNVRMEDGQIQYWTAAEIDHIETEAK